MPTQRELDDAERVRVEVDIPENGYLRVRVLPDASVAALGDLLYTRSIILGVDKYGWHRRFCFESRALAAQRFEELQSEDDVPEGFIARR